MRFLGPGPHGWLAVEFVNPEVHLTWMQHIGTTNKRTSAKQRRGSTDQSTNTRPPPTTRLRGATALPQGNLVEGLICEKHRTFPGSIVK